MSSACGRSSMLGGLRSAMRNLRASDQAVNRGLDRALLRNGINVIPGLGRFVSLAHGDDHFETTARAVDRAFRELDESGTRTATQAGFTW